MAKLRNGELARCVRVNLPEPRVVEIAAMTGFDCIWVDMEHAPNSVAHVENQVRAAKAYDVDVLVRVPRGSSSDLNYPLEMDAAGIMVPHVMSAADARQIVWQTRFHPIGRRPFDGGNADGAYCMVSTEEYVRHANHERFVVVQIEDPEPMSELGEIAQLPGIDMLFFGPGDFSQGLGAPGVLDHPDVDRARHEVAQAARRCGKWAGTVGSPESLRSLVDMGYQFVNVGADVLGLVEYFKRGVAAFSKY
jgi:4-hydroxy-2-oxoheptanedioate aldolase